MNSIEWIKKEKEHNQHSSVSVTDPFIIPIIFLSGREMAHDNKMKINLVVNYESKPVKSNLGWRHHSITWLHKTFKTEFRWPSWWQHQSASFCHWASSLLQASILRNRIVGKGGFQFSKFETWLVNYACYCENMDWCIHKATSV